MLYEKHRPKDWGEVVGQPKAIKTLQRLESAGKLGGKAYWITGKTGIGKTTIAFIIARKLAEECNIYEMDAGQLTVSILNEWAVDQHYVPMGKPGRCYILNEAHGLKPAVVRALLVFLESLREHTTVIFTTTLEGQLSFEGSQMDSSPLLSRCIPIRLQSMGLAAPFAKRMQEIAIAEGLDGQPLASYKRLAQKCKNNLRRMYNEIESGAMLAP